VRRRWAADRDAAQAAWARDGQPVPAAASGPFAYTNASGVTYYLHATAARVRGGGARTAYFFAPVPRAGEWLDALPAGYAVAEHRHNGVPYLRKS
jgi:hypothetical protein